VNVLSVHSEDIQTYPSTTIPVYSLVMTSRHLELAEEYVSVAKVTVGPSLSGLIPKLFGDEQPLPTGQTGGGRTLLRGDGKTREKEI